MQTFLTDKVKHLTEVLENQLTLKYGDDYVSSFNLRGQGDVEWISLFISAKRNMDAEILAYKLKLQIDLAEFIQRENNLQSERCAELTKKRNLESQKSPYVVERARRPKARQSEPEVQKSLSLSSPTRITLHSIDNVLTGLLYR